MTIRPGGRPRRGLVELDLLLDEVDEPGAHRARRDEQPLEPAARGEAGEQVEEAREVLADLRVAGEEAEVLVDPRRLAVVVAGADVAVADEALRLLAHDEAELGVGLEPDDAVDDVDARLLQLAGPRDVVDLVEAGLDLDDREHLLARLGRVDEGVDDGRVAGGPVERLLDREHLGVARRLLDEGLHRRRERVVGVLDEHVLVAHRREQVDRLRALGRGEVRVRAREELGELEVGAVDVGDGEEAAQVERRRQAVDLAVADLKLAGEHVEDLGVDVLLDLEPDRRTEAAPGQLLLERREEVLGVVLLDLEVLVAGDAEGEVLLDEHAGEELVEVGGDDVLERHEALALDLLPHSPRGASMSAPVVRG